MPVQYKGHLEDGHRWQSSSQDITAIVSCFVPNKRQKTLNNKVCVIPTNTPSKLRYVWKIPDKLKMPPTEGILTITCVQGLTPLNGNH